jgi:peroxiredoxin
MTFSIMQTLGTQAADFSLPNIDGTTVSLSDFTGTPLLVAFICNHCPYVIHIAGKLGEQTAGYKQRGLSTVLINANDPSNHGEDAPEHMPAFTHAHNIQVPYLYDSLQTAAQAYHAVCTPDFFLFDNTHTLVYRGRFDSSTPGNNEPVTGKELDAAVQAVLCGGTIPAKQHPSIGCSIKWKPGNQPAINPL